MGAIPNFVASFMFLALRFERFQQGAKCFEMSDSFRPCHGSSIIIREVRALLQSCQELNPTIVSTFYIAGKKVYSSWFEPKLCQKEQNEDTILRPPYTSSAVLEGILGKDMCSTSLKGSVWSCNLSSIISTSTDPPVCELRRNGLAFIASFLLCSLSRLSNAINRRRRFFGLT